MKTSMFKRYFCLLVVLLFVVPSVTALNAGNRIDDNIEIESEIKENNKINIKASENNIYDYIPAEKMSIEVIDLLSKYSIDSLEPSFLEYLARFNDQMLQRRDIFAREYSDLPYIPVDLTKVLGKYEPTTGKMISVFPDADISPRAEMFRFDIGHDSIFADTLQAAYVKPMSSGNDQPQTRTHAAPAHLLKRILS